MQQKSKITDQKKNSPIMHKISDIIFNFYKLLIFRTTLLEFNEYLDRFFFSNQ